MTQISQDRNSAGSQLVAQRKIHLQLMVHGTIGYIKKLQAVASLIWLLICALWSDIYNLFIFEPLPVAFSRSRNVYKLSSNLHIFQMFKGIFFGTNKLLDCCHWLPAFQRPHHGCETSQHIFHLILELQILISIQKSSILCFKHGSLWF